MPRSYGKITLPDEPRQRTLRYITLPQFTANQDDVPTFGYPILSLATDNNSGFGRSITGFERPKHIAFRSHGARIADGLPGDVVVNEGQMTQLWVLNRFLYKITFAHQNSGSAEENRIMTPSGTGVVLDANQWAQFVYDPEAQSMVGRWRLQFPAA